MSSAYITEDETQYFLDQISSLPDSTIKQILEALDEAGFPVPAATRRVSIEVLVTFELEVDNNDLYDHTGSTIVAAAENQGLDIDFLNYTLDYVADVSVSHTDVLD